MPPVGLPSAAGIAKLESRTRAGSETGPSSNAHEAFPASSRPAAANTADRRDFLSIFFLPSILDSTKAGEIAMQQ
jgi:hypothetical protein